MYAATVPKYIFEVGAEILMSRPWRRNEPEADDRFIPDEVGRQTATGGAADGHPQGMNRQSSANEPAIQRNEPEAGFPLSRSAHHVLEDHVIASASRSVATPFGRRNATAMQTINEATVRRENGIVRKLVMDHTRIEYDAADLLVRWLRANRPNVRDLIAYVQKLIDDNAIEPLLQCADVWDEAS
ncbi:MAG TPA: hypothetical protein VF082_12795 [Jiangellaceae bacterium]